MIVPHRRLGLALAGLLALFAGGQSRAADVLAGPAADAPGGALYAQHCAGCHDNPVDRIPPKVFLSIVKTPDQIVQALTSGIMRSQATGLSPEEIKQLAVFITGKQPGADTGPDQNANRCARPGPAMKLDVRDWNGWGRDSDNSRYQPQPGITAGNLARLKVKWVFAYPGNAVDGQPTLVGGRAFVTSRTGRVFALDAKTGCTYWSFAPEGGVRTAVTVNALPASAGAKFAVYFATENGYLHALDAETGKPVWTTRVEDHPVTRLTGSPALYKNRLYMPLASLEEVSVRNPKYACCTFRGGVVAVDAVTGAIVWKTHMIAEEPKQIGANASGTPMMGPAGVSIFSAPTIDAKQHVLYVGTGNSYTQISSDAANAIVALDLETGERRWASQVLADDDICARFDDPVSCAHRGPDYDFAASPILRRLRGGKDILVAASKAGEAYGFDPDDHGRLLWRVKLGPGTATAGTWGLAADATHVFIGSADVRPAAAAGAEIGGLSALDIATGKLLWHKVAPPPACGWEQPNGGASPPRVICSQAQPAALALIPGIVFSGSIDGHMRAFSARDGAILWDFDTAQSFEGVNGFKATGGSISNGAQTVASGALYVNSGAAGLHQPGNALIAFTIDGR